MVRKNFIYCSTNSGGGGNWLAEVTITAYSKSLDPSLIWGSNAGNNVGGMFGSMSVSGTRKYWQNMTMGGGGFGQVGGGGDSIPSSINWANNGTSIAAYGATVVGGSVGFVKSAATLRWYANAWTGNQYVETFDIARIGKGLGISTSLMGAGIGIVNFVLSDKSWGDYGQLGVSLLSAGLTLDGITAPAGIGIGIVDAAGGFNSLYNFLDIDQQLYKSTGIIMLPPIIGIPQFIP